MIDDAKVPSVGYVSDAAVNNAEILFGAERANVSALADLIGIVQSAVMNESLVVSQMAMKRSTLLQQLDFADCFRISEDERDGEKVISIKSPLPLPAGDVVLGVDEQGEPSANSAAGEFFLAMAWSEALQGDDVLGSLVMPERLSQAQPRGEAYFNKFAAFMCWLQADRNLIKFENKEASRVFWKTAERPLHLYRLLARRLVSCRDRFGLDLTCSVIEEPLFSLSLAQEVNEPLEYLEKFDAIVQGAIVAARPKAFERWRFPAVGAAVLGRCARLDDLPKAVTEARDRLQKPRNQIRAMNRDLVAFQREMDLGYDTHFKELNRLKASLQRALRAFGEGTSYQEELEAFPVSDRIWWLPRLFAFAMGAMKSPQNALADVAAMPWVQRQRFLRYVPGMRNAASYVKSLRTPIMEKIVQDLGRIDRQSAGVQCQTLDWARDLIRRCADLRSVENIGTKVLSGTGRLSENAFWLRLILDDSMRESFFLPKQAG
jgi:hypothetical protein